MSAESKKSPAEGRLVSHTPPAAADGLAAVVAQGVGQRGPGKRSQQFIAQVSAQYGALPGDVLAATLMDGLREHLAQGRALGAFLPLRARKLARYIGCEPEEAFDKLMVVSKELLPYLHQKQPIAVDIEQRSIVFAAVTSDGQVAAPGTGRRDLRPADVRNSPMKSVGGAERSDDDGRTGDANALKDQEE